MLLNIQTLSTAIVALSEELINQIKTQNTQNHNTERDKYFSQTTPTV